jgi:Fe2+ transport system protein FeoA
VPGTCFELLAVEPFEGPLSLRLDGQVQHIGRKVGEAIYVQPLSGMPSDDANGTQ